MSAIPITQREQALRPLPGIAPVGREDWITVTDDYAAQLADKARLIEKRRSDVYASLPEAEAPADEMRDHVLTLLRGRDGFHVDGGVVTCPDGRTVDTGSLRPLLALGQLLQEDICIHLKQGGEHHLVGALLCFPASWTLAEKIGKPLSRIHAPVAPYDSNIAKRVQRLFDGVQVGRPLWRANYLTYADPELFHPKREADPPHLEAQGDKFVRSERQTLIRLPKTRAVVFTIHTTVTPVLTPSPL